jgi:predicted nucleic acid-binding protein
MILVDTNVVSETMRPAPDPAVICWLDAQLAESLYLSTVSLAELLLGVAVLSDGRRKLELGSALLSQAVTLFGDRVLAFDVPAAHAYATIVSGARAAGVTIGVADGQIAAIATVRGLAVATRDKKPFEAAGLNVIDPWTTSL